MIPRPPTAISGSVSASSPDSTMKSSGTARQISHICVDVARRFLDADDVRDRRRRTSVAGLDVAAGAAGHVVDDDRQADRVGDRAVVLEQPFGRGLVVVRRHRQDARRASVAHAAAQLRSLPACCSRRRRRAPALRRSASSTTSSTTRTRSSSVSVGLSPVVPQGTRKWMPASICRRASRRTRRFVQRAVARERRDERGAATGKSAHSHFPRQLLADRSKACDAVRQPNLRTYHARPNRAVAQAFRLPTCGHRARLTTTHYTSAL